MQERNEEVIDLETYRQTHQPTRPLITPDQQHDHEVIEEIAFHLLLAIQALKKIRH
jgi:hypothetical protein